MRRGLACVIVAGAAFFAASVPANAAFHEMKIREVYAGSAAGTDGDFVELQMYSAGQNFTAGHNVTVHNSAGAPTQTIPLANVARGENNRTILIGPASGIPGGVAPDIVFNTLDLPLTGGAVCFPDGVPQECVSWGDCGGICNAALVDPQIGPAAPAGITAGSSLDRSIAAGNPDLLENADDTDNAFADFALDATPTPCPNSQTQTATFCSAPTAVDSDGDGIPDASDNCPNQAGPASNNGCPQPDADGDGVPDSTDQCPNQSGPALNNGCPVGGTDNAPPTQKVTGKKTQDVDKLALTVTPNEAATLVGTGTVTIPGGNKVVKFKKVTKSAAADQKVKLRFKLAKGALKDVKAAIEDANRKAKLKVTATDAAGNKSTVRKTITLTD